MLLWLPLPCSARARTTDPDARIAMVEKQIERLETLNASRRELIAKTEEKLNQRKEALRKSEAMLEAARAKRERIIEYKERPPCQKPKRPPCARRKRPRFPP